MRRLVAASVMIVGLAYSSAQSAELWYETDFALRTRYLWRGMVLTDGAVFQPSLTAGIGSLCINIWGNQDLGDANEASGSYTELDYTLDYSYENEESGAGLSIGVMAYTYPYDPSADPTGEVYVIMSLGGTFSPTVQMIWDVGTVTGSYYNIGASYSKENEVKGSEWSVGLGLGFGDPRNNEANIEGMYYWEFGLPPGTDIEGGATDLGISLAWSKSVGEGMSLNLDLGMAVLLGEFADAVDDIDEKAFNYALGVSWSAEF